MERSNGIGEGEVIFYLTTLKKSLEAAKCKDVLLHRCAASSQTICASANRFLKDYERVLRPGKRAEAQAAPCGKRLPQVISDYRKIATLDRDKAVK
ncbi:hypothetical protein CXF70_09290 [Planomicrobium sp. MB-3u-38]|nr:hypothetical protein CXF70_09290 [Planomicrobium sp. MB-3u-38]